MTPAPKDPQDRTPAPDTTRKAGGRQRDRQARPDSAQATDPARPAGRPIPNPYPPPAYVIEVWISPEMRARNPDRPLTLCEVLKIGRQPKPDRQPEPDLEPEP